MNQTGRGRPAPARRRSLVSLAGAVILLLLLNGAIGLYGLRYVNLKHLQALDTVDTLIESLDDALQAQIHFKVQVQEWKNILLRGHVPGDFEAYAAAFEREAAIVSEHLRDLHDDAAVLEVEPAEIEGLIVEFDRVMSSYRDALSSHAPGNPEAAWATDARIRGIDRTFANQLDALAERARALTVELRERVANEARERAGTIERVSMIGTALTLGLLIVMMAMALRRR